MPSEPACDAGGVARRCPCRGARVARGSAPSSSACAAPRGWGARRPGPRPRRSPRARPRWSPPPSETSEPAPPPESLGTSFSESPSARAARESGEPGAGSGARAAEDAARRRRRLRPRRWSPSLPPAAAASRLDAWCASSTSASLPRWVPLPPPRWVPLRSGCSSGAAFVVAIGDVRLGVGAVAAPPRAPLGPRAPTPLAQGRADAVRVSPHISAMRSSRNAAAPSTPEARMLRCRRAAASVAGLSETRNTTRQSAACFAAMRTASRTACGGRSAVCFRVRRVLVALGPVKPPAAARALLPGDPEQARATHGAVTLLPQRVQRLQRALDAPHRLLARGVSSGVGSAGARCALSFCTISVWKMPWCTLIAQGQGARARRWRRSGTRPRRRRRRPPPPPPGRAAWPAAR